MAAWVSVGCFLSADHVYLWPISRACFHRLLKPLLPPWKKKGDFQWQTSSQLQACSVPGTCVSEALYTSLLFFWGEYFPRSKNHSNFWLNCFRLKQRESCKVLESPLMPVQWVYPDFEPKKLILSLLISSPYHRGAVALAFHCFLTGLKKNKEDSEMP